MSLSDLASLGSLVSGVAVVVSLVFLYFQLRQLAQQVKQAEKNQRATVAQVRTGRTVQVLLQNCEPSMADAYNKVMRGDADLTFAQVRQFMSYVRAMLLNGEDMVLQHRQGLVEEGAYRAFVASFGRVMAFPAFRSAWRLYREASGEEFSDFVEKLIDETPVRAPPSLAVWQSVFAEVSATLAPAEP